MKILLARLRRQNNRYLKNFTLRTYAKIVRHLLARMWTISSQFTWVFSIRWFCVVTTGSYTVYDLFELFMIPVEFIDIGSFTGLINASTIWSALNPLQFWLIVDHKPFWFSTRFRKKKVHTHFANIKIASTIYEKKKFINKKKLYDRARNDIAQHQ